MYVMLKIQNNIQIEKIKQINELYSYLLSKTFSGSPVLKGTAFDKSLVEHAVHLSCKNKKEIKVEIPGNKSGTKRILFL